MIKLVTGNLLKADAEAIVNTVNCVGVMGRGIAAQFKKAFPDNFKEYKKLCDKKGLFTGQMFIFELIQDFYSTQKYLINFPTKRHWKGASKIEDIESGLKALIEDIKKYNIKSIAIPPLGCGLGGLDWQQVKGMIETAFEELPTVEVLLYEPKGAPKASSMLNNTKRPNMTVGRASLLGLMKRYIQGLMDTEITLLEVQKLMYFMQEAGESLQLKYTKGHYGPYATNLKNVLQHIEGHFIIGYGDGGEKPDKAIEYIPKVVEEAEVFLEKHEKTKQHFKKVVDLIQGFETPYGMELLSTVHWLMKHENYKNLEDIKIKVFEWNTRKREIIKANHIEIAYNTLLKKGWSY